MKRPKNADYWKPQLWTWNFLFYFFNGLGFGWVRHFNGILKFDNTLRKHKKLNIWVLRNYSFYLSNYNKIFRCFHLVKHFKTSLQKLASILFAHNGMDGWMVGWSNGIANNYRSSFSEMHPQLKKSIFLRCIKFKQEECTKMH